MKHITLAVACIALLAAPALGDWTEDFQAYAVGSSIDGQGGWAGWDLTPFPAPNALVSEDHAKFAGDHVLKEIANNDMVQQYTGYTSGAWIYRAKQYIPASQHGKGGLAFILMNNYNIGGTAPKGWGSQMNFDLNNDVVNDGETNTGGVPVVYDQWIDLRVEIDLENDFRATYYNNTRVGIGRWYDKGDANHAKSVAAVDLWADVAGDPVYYDDLSLTPGTVATFAGSNITTDGSVAARYLVNFGFGLGDTIITGSSGPSGLYEISNSGGNQNAWWHLNEGNPGESSSMVTFLGASPDYVGYHFKLSATVNQIVWYNDARYGDGGTFAAQPDVQYLDGMFGTWQTKSDVTWDVPYANNFGGGVRRYSITFNTPATNVWGIRLIGDSQPGVDDTGTAGGPNLPGTGFLGVTEMALYGSVNFGSLDVANNLALKTKGGIPIANRWQTNTAAGIDLINDGLYDNQNTTFGSADAEDYIGITWPTPQNNVAAVGFVAKGFRDGGWIGTLGGSLPQCPSNLTVTMRIETTTDGTTWMPVSGLDVGRYPQDVKDLYRRAWGPTTAFLFRFTPVSGITGIRVIGDTLGYATADNNGFLGCREFEVFANAAPPVKSPQGKTASLSSKNSSIHTNVSTGAGSGQ